MTARRVYTDEDRARAFVAYTANAGNMKRTARDTGLPQSTLRAWISDWNDNGPPDTSQVAEIASEFVESATTVRDEALAELRRKIPTAKPSELVAAVGMLSDKIAMAKGLATSRTETVQALPTAEDIGRALGQTLQAALHAARERDGEIIDAEVAELPRASQ